MEYKKCLKLLQITTILVYIATLTQKRMLKNVEVLGYIAKYQLSYKGWLQMVAYLYIASFLMGHQTLENLEVSAYIVDHR